MPSALKIREIVTFLDRKAPPGTAESWDNVGLLLGSSEWKTSGVIVSGDLTAEAIKLAQKKKYRLIVTHHPCIFPKNPGISKVNDPLLVAALESGIAVYSSHTNFDQSALECVNLVSKALQVKPLGRFYDYSSSSSGSGLLKLVTYVPAKDLKAVRSALFEAGAGQIGHYDQCGFSSNGKGSFRGSLEHSSPAIGKPGKFEEVDETRFETILPVGLKDVVVAALLESHPYEEVAHDLFPVIQKPGVLGVVRGLGYGFFGDLEQAIPFSELAQRVSSQFELSGFTITEPRPKKVRRLGFVAGKGSSFIRSAISAHCDVFITGEAGYHAALSGSRSGLAVMEIGHRESERFFIETMSSWLKAKGVRTAEISDRVQSVVKA